MAESRHSRGSRWLRRAATGLLLAGLSAFWLYFHLRSPGTAYALYDYDPETIYLMASLGPFRGVPYLFIDHPGTPVELLGTLLLALTYPFVGSDVDGFVDFHIRHPAVFIVMAHAALALTHLLAVFLLARRALKGRHWADAVAAAAIAASFHALSPLAPFSLVYWSHNALAFPAGAALLLGLVAMLRRIDECRPRHAVILGLGAGLAAAIQLLFATWIVSLAVALMTASYCSSKRVARALVLAAGLVAAAVLGFVLATLPILPRYRFFWSWIWKLARHQGMYGQGSVGLPEASVWIQNLKSMWSQGEALLLGTALALLFVGVALAADRRPMADRIASRALALGVCIQMGITLILIAKHPSVFYLWIVGACVPFLFLAGIDSLQGQRWGALARVSVAGLVFWQLGMNLWKATERHERRLRHRAALLKALEDERLKDADSKPLPLFWTYGFTDPHCYPLWFGGEYANRAFWREIARVCPFEGFFHVWSSQLFSPGVMPNRPEAAGFIITTDYTLRVFPDVAKQGPPVDLGVDDPTYGRIWLVRLGPADPGASPWARGTDTVISEPTRP